MALIGNQSVLNKSFAFFTNGTTTAGAYAGNTRSNWTNPSVIVARFTNMNSKAAWPVGYGVGDAYIGPKKNGGIASINRMEGVATLSATAISARLSTSSMSGVASLSASLAVLTPGAATLNGAATLSGSIQAVSSLASALSGAASLSANLSAIVPLAASMSGAATVSANLKGIGRLEAAIDVGASDPLSPTSLADAVWDTVLAEHVDAGTTGAALADAGGAGNPWSADLSTNNTPGTFGYLVQKLLTVAKFLGLK